MRTNPSGSTAAADKHLDVILSEEEEALEEIDPEAITEIFWLSC